MLHYIFTALRLNGRAEGLLELMNDRVDCDEHDCLHCPFYHPVKNLQIVGDDRETHCGYVFINRAIREVLDRAPRED